MDLILKDFDDILDDKMSFNFYFSSFLVTYNIT